MFRTDLDQTMLKRLRDLFPEIEVTEGANAAVIVHSENLIALLEFVHTDAAFGFDLLGNLTAVDYPDRFEMVYHLHCRGNGHTLTVKTSLEKSAPAVDSVTPIWPSAGFQEREVFDLMGIYFNGHMDLRRILLPDDFSGHPLRKDFKQKNAEARC